MLEVSHLSVSYGAHRALEDVSIRVEEGEICVILGANGAGKTSLLKAIAGLIRPQNGSRIAISDVDITNARPDQIVEAGLALVPEGRGIFGDLRVAENLRLGAYGRRARAEEAKHREEVLRLFPQLGERRGQVARTMSGGEQQMVAIARALMSNPAILMMDEPSLGLSPLLTKELFRSLKAVRETGVGILLVEQNARQSLAIADRGYLIENGHIVGEDRAENLARDPAVQAAYLGGAAAQASYRRLGEKAPAATVRIPAGSTASTTVADLAERASQIHRRHIATIRGGAVNGAVNEHHVPVPEDRKLKGEAIMINRQAEELSKMAGEMAQRAARIQRRYAEALRLTGKPTAIVAESDATMGGSAADASGDDHAAVLAARAASIQSAHVASLRSSQTGMDVAPLKKGKKPDKRSGKKTKKAKRGKKAGKEARQIAKEARKLAKKALRMID